jgi:selenium metabolism protein YedF
MTGHRENAPPSKAGDTSEIDVRGLVCPEPVVRTRQALAAAGGAGLDVVTGSSESRDNIIRLGEREGCRTSWREREPGVFIVHLEPQERVSAGEQPAGDIVFISSDCIGRGDDKLGRLLTSLFLRTLGERPAKPAFLLLANSGVKLALDDSDDSGTLEALECQGVRIMVCGTCLDFFGAKERLRAGIVSNMYEMVDILMSGARLVRV